MNNLRKFSTEAEYSAATLNYPAVSWVTATDNVYFNKTAPAAFSGLTVYYNITDISQPTVLFNGGGSSSGSGSGSGVLPSAMIIDDTAVEVTNTYQFSTTGEHIVNYSFADNQIPQHFLDDEATGRFSTVTKLEIGDTLTSIGNAAFNFCSGLTCCTIGSGVISIGSGVFSSCSSLTSVTIPNSVTSIEGDAFSYCTSLTSVTIGSGVLIINGAAFSSCSSLTSITSNAITAPTIQSNTFMNVKTGGTLTVPSGSSGYDVWMQNANYYLGLYGWTKVEQ